MNEKDQLDPSATSAANPPAATGPLAAVVRFCLENKLIVGLITLGVVVWGLAVAPFDWKLGNFPRSPVAVDAIPDIGENQQIVFTPWMGRSPQDVEDQITYPLTASLMGLPGVKTIRSYSYFGFSSIYIIFKEDIEFYWSRSRILEKLNSLPAGTVPDGVTPSLGPDATALGQVFWYTLEGLDPQGRPTGGWGLDELRSIQDFTVRYALQGVDGVSEVASAGGYVREYQVDVDPDALRAHNVSLEEVYNAVRMSNQDVGARTLEVNQVEYVVRGVGFLENLDDLKQTVVKTVDGVPVFLQQLGHIQYGPAPRRGALDKAGAPAVGGVVVVRYGENPLEVIKGVKRKIEEISAGLPRKVMEDGTVSKVSIVPFYDRTGLIYETLGTLRTALTDEILVTIVVVLFMLMNLKASILISLALPMGVLLTFIVMKIANVPANIVALSGIAIAIGTMVDLGIVMSENILKHLERAGPGERRLEVIHRAIMEVAGALLTAISTTVVSFLPVFTMVAAEGKLFKPLAFTKTFALISSAIVAIFILPVLAHLFYGERKVVKRNYRSLLGRLRASATAQVTLRHGLALIAGLAIVFGFHHGSGWFLAASGTLGFLAAWIRGRGAADALSTWIVARESVIHYALLILAVLYLLASTWLPLGPEAGNNLNFLFAGVLLLGILGLFRIFLARYEGILNWCLNHKGTFLVAPVVIVALGLIIWLGAAKIFFFLPEPVKESRVFTPMAETFPGLGREFMPDLDEGSYLFMPTTMPHAGVGEVLDQLSVMDRAIQSIPEVETVVGKMGRAESALDPAPISMYEVLVNYKNEYRTDSAGHRLSFAYDSEREVFLRDAEGELIPDPDGRPFRQWREKIRTPDDIWDEILLATELPGLTSAPKLQPIATRIVMLQSGMRAPLGIKVRGPDLATIEKVGLELEQMLKEVEGVSPAAVLADRIVGKPYLEVHIDREAAARYGIPVTRIQQTLEVAAGGKTITQTVEGRERYPVRVRYLRELRDRPEALERILVAGQGGVQVPLEQVAEIRYQRGPMVIKSEDTFLTGYVVFDKLPGYAEVDVVENAQRYLNEKLAAGEWELPAGVSYAFAGSYQNQLRAQKTLSVVLPLALGVIFLIIYFQFRNVSSSLIVFTEIPVSWAGGFLMLWLYNQPGFLDFSLFDTNLRELFQVREINLSVAVWVGFLALFGIATDDGVIMCTYLEQLFKERAPKTIAEIRAVTLEAGLKRIRPALMTVSTTLLALLPVLTSSGRGSDIMIPMAIPSFGGMAVGIIAVFVIPVLYCLFKERELRAAQREADAEGRLETAHV